MREEADLPAMVGFVGDHVAKHFRARRPGLPPAVSAKLIDAAFTIAERFREHFRTASCTFGQSRAGLLWRATRAVELPWNLHMGSRKPHPLGADVMHVREYRRDRAHFAGRPRCPRVRVEIFDETLVQALIGSEDPHCSSPELGLNLGLTRGHDDP